MHYVIGDVHCQIDALTILLSKLNLKEDDEVYFVGDWFDRFYKLSDFIATVKWMVSNLKNSSRFKSVCGNHDLDMLDTMKGIIERFGFEEGIRRYMENVLLLDRDDICELIPVFKDLYDILQAMPLSIELDVKGTEYIVTHSWIVDSNGNSILSKEFNSDRISIMNSVWDREFSMCNYMPDNKVPIIIHGHTPTLGRNELTPYNPSPLAKIIKIGNNNINIDCCAFRSPMLGGNLAAYRCEDSAEIYAYDDEAFYTLAKMWDETVENHKRRFNIYEYIFTVLFYDRYTQAIFREDMLNPVFDNKDAEESHRRMKSLFEKYDRDSAILEAEVYTRKLKRIVVDSISSYWVGLRERYQHEVLGDIYVYDHSHDKLSQNIINRLFS